MGYRQSSSFKYILVSIIAVLLIAAILLAAIVMDGQNVSIEWRGEEKILEFDGETYILKENVETFLVLGLDKYDENIISDTVVKNELSLDYAMGIERASWATTELLTDGLEEYTEVAEADEGIVFEETTEKPLPTQNKTSNDDESWISKALSLAIENNNAGFEALSHSLGMLPDALCEAVNDRLYDTVGDIVIENVEGKYQVIVDYLEEIKEWMKK